MLQLSIVAVLCYNVSMEYEIILKPEAVQDIDHIHRYHAAAIADAMEVHLTTNPTVLSRSRIKKLKGKQKADYRLRVEDFRVFYNVNEQEKRVFVLRVLHKDKTKYFYREVLP